MRCVQGGTRDNCVVDDALGEHCDSDPIGAVKGREYAWISYGLHEVGTGIVYGYPIREAAEIAVREVKGVLTDHPDLEVIFCCFSAGDKAVYESLVG